MADVGRNWQVGVFRQLRHWVAEDARTATHHCGVTYYAVCGSPCLYVPELRRIWGSWPHCAVCVARVWDIAGWGRGVLQDHVAHIRGYRPEFALCDALLVADLPDIGTRHDLRACSHCVALRIG